MFTRWMLVIGMLVSGPSAAAGFVGIGGGLAEAEMQYAGEEHAVGLKVFVGGEINENVAVEVGALMLDEMSFSAAMSGASAAVDQTGSALHVALMGRMPVGPVTLYHKVGGQFWTVDADGTVDYAGTTYRAKGRKHGMGALVGLGVELAASDVWSLRVEAERYFDVGEDLELKAQGVDASVVFKDGEDVDVLSASITYSF